VGEPKGPRHRRRLRFDGLLCRSARYPGAPASCFNHDLILFYSCAHSLLCSTFPRCFIFPLKRAFHFSQIHLPVKARFSPFPVYHLVIMHCKSEPSFWVNLKQARCYKTFFLLLQKKKRVPKEYCGEENTVLSMIIKKYFSWHQKTFLWVINVKQGKSVIWLFSKIYPWITNGELSFHRYGCW